jgi:hypothetical protein
MSLFTTCLLQLTVLRRDCGGIERKREIVRVKTNNKKVSFVDKSRFACFEFRLFDYMDLYWILLQDDGLSTVVDIDCGDMRSSGCRCVRSLRLGT